MLTTCARDYITWANHYPEGEEVLNGVRVRRFPVDAHPGRRALLGRHRLACWGASPASEPGRFDPAVREPDQRGRRLRVARRAGALVPAPAGRAPLEARATLRRPRLLLLPLLDDLRGLHGRRAPGAARPHRRRRRRLPPAPLPAPLPEGASARLQQRRGARHAGSRGGRPASGRGRGRGHRAARPARRRGASGAATGSRALSPLRGPHRPQQGLRRALRLLPALSPRDGVAAAARPDRQGGAARSAGRPGIVPLGFLPDQEKWNALAASLGLVMPSWLESLSMVTLEAFWAERPVLANARCDVLRGQCRRSNAGLYYATYDEFREALALLERDAEPARDAWAGTAARYFEAHYAWDGDRAEVPGPPAAHHRGAPAGRRRDPRPPASRMSARPRRVHQLLAAPRATATPSATKSLAIQQHLRAAGFESDIFAEKVQPAHGPPGPAPLASTRRSRRRRRCASSTSRSAAPRGGSSTTPPTAWSRSTTTSPPPASSSASTRTSLGLCYHGRRELEAFAPRTELGLGDSEYNRRSSRPRASRAPRCCPSCSTSPPTTDRPLPVVRRLYGDGRTNLLFVGPHHPQQEDRRPHPGLRGLQALSRSRRAASSWWATPRPRALLRPPAGDGPRAPARRRGLHRPRGRRRARGLLPRRRTSSSASPSTRASACPCRRPCTSACPWSPTTPGPCARPCTAAGVLLREKRPEVVAELVHAVLHDPSPARRRVLGDPGPRAIAEIRRHRLRRASPGSSRPRARPPAWLSGPSPMRRIDQWVPALHRGDAIGDSARLMRDAFRRWGYEADVYALDAGRRPRGRRPPVLDLAAREDRRTSSSSTSPCPRP